MAYSSVNWFLPSLVFQMVKYLWTNRNITLGLLRNEKNFYIAFVMLFVRYVRTIFSANAGRQQQRHYSNFVRNRLNRARLQNVFSVLFKRN